MSSDVLIHVEDVSKKFCRNLRRSLWYGLQDTAADLLGRGESSASLRPEEFWAVDDVSFSLKRGECLGLVGRNGAGKTTVLKMLNGLIKPDKGRIEIRGRVGALIALGAGFNPILTGRENVYVNGAVLGLSKREISERIDEIIDFAEIGDFIEAPVQSYSSGMQVRLGFAVATAMKPDVLLLDEVLAVGDAEFQAKCYRRIGKILEDTAVVLVSHFPHHVRKVCDTAMWLSKGRKQTEGSPDEILALYAKSAANYTTEPLTLFGDGIDHAEVVAVTPRIKHGDDLHLALRVNASRKVRCDLAQLNINDAADNVHAQVTLTNIGALEPGLTEFSLVIGPLHLSSGRFHGNLMLSGSQGKTTLAHMRRGFTFENTGPANLGPFYYPPYRISRSTRTAGAQLHSA